MSTYILLLLWTNQPTYNKSKHGSLPSLTHAREGSTPLPIYSDSIIYTNDANKAIIVTAPPTNAAPKVGFVTIHAEAAAGAGDIGDRTGNTASLPLNCPRMTPGSTGFGNVRRGNTREIFVFIYNFNPLIPKCQHSRKCECLHMDSDISCIDIPKHTMYPSSLNPKIYYQVYHGTKSQTKTQTKSKSKTVPKCRPICRLKS